MSLESSHYDVGHSCPKDETHALSKQLSDIVDNAATEFLASDCDSEFSADVKRGLRSSHADQGNCSANFGSIPMRRWSRITVTTGESYEVSSASCATIWSF